MPTNQERVEQITFLAQELADSAAMAIKERDVLCGEVSSLQATLEQRTQEYELKVDEWIQLKKRVGLMELAGHVTTNTSDGTLVGNLNASKPEGSNVDEPITRRPPNP